MVEEDEIALVIYWPDQIELASSRPNYSNKNQYMGKCEHAPESLGYLGRFSMSLAHKGQYVLVVGDNPKQFSG